MDHPDKHKDMRIAIAGFGAIGKTLANALDAGIPGMRLVAVAGRDVSRTRASLATLRQPVACASIEQLPAIADVIIECAPAHLLPAIAEPALTAGRTLVVLSVGALLAHAQLVPMAEKYGARLLVPSGALGGLDAVAALAEGVIHSATLVTHKPLHSFVGTSLCVEEISAPVCVFSGTAREAAKAFPANINVAAALAFAGIGADRTMVEIWADPDAQCNTHQIDVDADAAHLSLTIRNRPSDNPKTSRIAAPSVIALLRKMRASFQIGS